MSIKWMIRSNHLILCCPWLLLPSIFLSIRVFSNELALCIRWPGFWSFNFSILPSNEYLWLISFKIDWFDLLTVQGTLKCLLQYHNLKASIPQHSALFMVQLSHLFMTTGKTIPLTIPTFDYTSKVMSLLFNTLSRFVICHTMSGIILKLSKSEKIQLYPVVLFKHFYWDIIHILDSFKGYNSMTFSLFTNIHNPHTVAHFHHLEKKIYTV